MTDGLRVIRANLLADAAGAGISVMIDTHPDCQGATAADVCNGALTLANRAIIVILKLSLPEELERNRSALKQAVMQLLMTTATDEAPKG